MGDRAIGGRTVAVTIGLSLLFWVPLPAHAQNNSSAHSIADKFAKEAAKPSEDAKRRADAAKKKREDERRRAEESEMLTAAQREAEERRAELEKQRAEQEAAELADSQRKANEDRVVAEAKAADEIKRLEAARIADEQRIAAEKKTAEEKRVADLRLAEDQRRIADAKAAEEAKRLADAKAAEERRIADLAEAARKAAEFRLSEERRAAEQAAEAARVAATKAAEEKQLAEAREHANRIAEDARKTALIAERETEARRVTETVRQARMERELKANDVKIPVAIGQAVPTLSTSTIAEDRQTTGANQLPANPAFSGRVAVLLLLEPGNRGIRRHNKTADPLLCNETGCYVSNGAEADATFMPGRRALGMGRTFGARAGACTHSLGCIFRGVELGSLPGMLQPIDMRVMRHDRREPQHIDRLADCKHVAGRLACRTTIHASNYIMWVIPEAMAAQVGTPALEQALADGLPDSNHAALTDSPPRQ